MQNELSREITYLQLYTNARILIGVYKKQKLANACAVSNFITASANYARFGQSALMRRLAKPCVVR